MIFQVSGITFRSQNQLKIVYRATCVQKRPQDAAKTRQDVPKTPQDVPRRPKTAPRRLQDASKTPQGVPKTRASPIFWYHCAPSNPLLTCYQFYWFYRAIVSVMIHCTSGSVGFINPLSAVPFPKMRAAALAEGLYN